MNRCTKCSKKISLAGTFSCICGKEFCSGHRFADQHDCNSIEKSKEKHIRELKERLIEVIAPKLEKC